MKLVDDWRDVLRGAWSVRLMVLAAVLSALPVFFSLVNAHLLGMDQIVFAVLAAIASALAVVARILRQVASRGFLRRFRKDECGAVGRKGLTLIAGVSLAASVAFVAPWEGLRTEAYRDIVGIWTVCYGETKGVEQGDKYSERECEAMLYYELQNYANELGHCLTVPVPEGTAVAFLSWAYNVGTSAACRSTLVRKANAGDLRGACDELSRWVYAGGKRVKGLENRRADERAACHSALDQAGL